MAIKDDFPPDDRFLFFSPNMPMNPNNRISGKLGTVRLFRRESSRRVFWL